MLSAKYFFLLLLIAQNTSKTLILRAAVGGKGHFLYSAAVLATEGLKATSSVIWVLNTGGSPATIYRFLRIEWRILVRAMIPAGIYNAQQMLEFVALARLEAPVFSVIVQIKLLTTALFSYLVLGKKLRGVQFIALVLLMVGVILAQMKDGQSNHLALEAETTVGVVATLLIATLSGFAAVYTERVLKHSKLVAHSQQDVRRPAPSPHPHPHPHPNPNPNPHPHPHPQEPELARQLTEDILPNCGVACCAFDFTRGPRMITSVTPLQAAQTPLGGQALVIQRQSEQLVGPLIHLFSCRNVPLREGSGRVYVGTG